MVAPVLDRQVLGSVATSGAVAVAGILSGVVLARSLGPNMRGELAALTSWATAVALVGDLGIGSAIAYHVGRDQQRAHHLLKQAVVAATLLGFPLWIAAEIAVGPRLRVPHIDAAWLWFGFSAIVPIILTGFVTYLLLGLGHVRDANLIRLSASVSYTAGVVALFIYGQGKIQGYLAAFWGAQILALLVALSFAMGSSRLRWPSGWGRFRDLVYYGLKAQFGSLAAQANLRLDQLVMSLVLPPGELGHYVVAIAVSSISMPAMSGLALVATPRVLAATSGREGALRGFRLVGLGAVTALIAAIIFTPTARWLVVLIFGTQFEGSVTAARLLLVASIFQGANQILGAVLRATGRPGASARSEVLGLVVTAVLLPLLLPRFGILGAAVTSLAAYVCVSAVGASSLKSASGLDWGEILVDLARATRNNLGVLPPSRRS